MLEQQIDLTILPQRFFQIGDYEIAYAEGQVKINYEEAALPVIKLPPKGSTQGTVQPETCVANEDSQQTASHASHKSKATFSIFLHTNTSGWRMLAHFRPPGSFPGRFGVPRSQASVAETWNTGVFPCTSVYQRVRVCVRAQILSACSRRDVLAPSFLWSTFLC